MVLASDFFTSPAEDICQIYTQVVNIFVDNFRTFAVLALLQQLASIPVAVIFLLIAFVTLASEIAIVSQAMNNGVTCHPSGGHSFGGNTVCITNTPITRKADRPGLVFCLGACTLKHALRAIVKCA